MEASADQGQAGVSQARQDRKAVTTNIRSKSRQNGASARQDRGRGRAHLERRVGEAAARLVRAASAHPVSAGSGMGRSVSGALSVPHITACRGSQACAAGAGHTGPGGCNRQASARRSAAQPHRRLTGKVVSARRRRCPTAGLSRHRSSASRHSTTSRASQTCAAAAVAAAAAAAAAVAAAAER